MARLRFPRSILELGRIFKDDDTCLAYLFDIRWPHGFVCPNCGGGEGYGPAEEPELRAAGGWCAPLDLVGERLGIR